MPLTNMPPFLFFIFLVFSIVLFGAVLWKLISPQLVGSIECPCFSQVGKASRNARVLILRRGAEKSGLPTVDVQVRFPLTIQSYLYTPGEAHELADMLEEAARKLDPR
jgi:hypothetical protein